MTTRFSGRDAKRRLLPRLNGKESKMDGKYASMGFVTFLFGIFCAYWAQTTNRNAWAWFFFGLFLAPIAGVVLLYKNSKDRQAAKAA